MNITIPFDDLPEAQQWENGEMYDITVRQISKNSSGAIFEVIGSADGEIEDNAEDSVENGIEEDDMGEKTYSRIRK